MVFAHDTETALLTAAALVNTDSPTDGDTLRTLADLDEFVRQWGFTGSRAHNDSELRAVRALRAPLRRLWTCRDDAEGVAGVVHVDHRTTSELAVQVVGRLLQFVRGITLDRFDDLVRDLAPGRHE